MSFIGNSFTSQQFTPAVDYFNGNSSTTAFTLSKTVGSVYDIQVVIENVPQNPASAFTVSGNVITFTSAPPTGTNNIYVRYTSPMTNVVKPAPGTVSPTEINSSYSLWNLSGADINYTAGKVGIGTTTSLSQLTSLGTTSIVANSVSTRNPVASFRGGNDNNRLDVLVDNSGASCITGLSAWNVAGASSVMAFYTGTTGTEAMRISSTGNVGIGTNSPSYNLVVNNQIAIQNSYPTQIPAIKGTYFGYSPGSYQVVMLGTTSGNQTVSIGVDPASITGGSFNGTGAELIVRNVFAFLTPNAGNTDFIAVLRFNNGSVTVPGSLSKGSGSFRIDHPLPTLEETHQLVHSFIEGPQADLIYRGVATLVAGKAVINIDTAAGMTEGTFEVLCREVQCFTTNESDWVAVRGKVVGNILTIEAQDTTATSTISWMVIGERKDKHMLETEWTDENGKVIVEPLKPVEDKKEAK